jgi:hypothetical protein
LFKHSVLKNYVRGGNIGFGGVDRVEVATNDVTDFRGILKGVENLPSVRERFSQITTNFRNAQQDILQTFLDRGEFHQLAQPTVTGQKRVPGLKLDNPRQLGLMHALVAFSHVMAGHFTTSEVYPRVLQALGFTADHEISRAEGPSQQTAWFRQSAPETWCQSRVCGVSPPSAPKTVKHPRRNSLGARPFPPAVK